MEIETEFQWKKINQVFDKKTTFIKYISFNIKYQSITVITIIHLSILLAILNYLKGVTYNKAYNCKVQLVNNICYL